MGSIQKQLYILKYKDYELLLLAKMEVYRRETHFASSHNWKKDNNKFKDKKQPELPENWTALSPTNKEIKNKHSSRLVGGAKAGSCGRGGAWQGDGRSHI